MNKYILVATITALSTPIMAAEVCQGYGPQTPRDIDSHMGTNDRIFVLADGYQNMNL